MRYRNYGNPPGLGLVAYIIITCIILYIAVSINDNLLNIFGFIPADFSHHPWSVVTSIFLHSPFPDFTHILFNMLVLYFFGNFLIGLIGNVRFLIVFLLGGIAGNLLFMLLNVPYSLVIGASGALFAVEGALVVLRPRLPVMIFPIPVNIPLWGAVIGAFLLTFIASGNIAWEAHLGGLAFGLLAGLFFRYREIGRIF
jgi:uncharacterized protein